MRRVAMMKGREPKHKHIIRTCKSVKNICVNFLIPEKHAKQWTVMASIAIAFIVATAITATTVAAHFYNNYFLFWRAINQLYVELSSSTTSH